MSESKTTTKHEDQDETRGKQSNLHTTVSR